MLMPAFVVTMFVHLFVPPPVHLHYGPRTTVLSGPRYPVGTINYVEALNQRMSKGVTRKNNAFVGIALTMRPADAKAGGDWPSKAHRRKVFRRLGLKRSEAGPYWVSIDEVAKQADEDETKVGKARNDAMARPWTDADHPIVAKWLKANHKVMARIERASKKPRYDAPLIANTSTTWSPVMGVNLPSLRYVRATARAFAARAERSVQAGHLKAAWSDVLVLKRLARLMPQQPNLISHLVGISLDALSRSVVRDIAASDVMTPALARQMLHDVNKLRPMPPMSHTIDVGSRFNGLDAVQHLWAQGVSEPNGLLGIPPFLQAVGGFSSPYFNVNAALRSFNRLYDQQVKIARISDFDKIQTANRKADKALKQHVFDSHKLPRLPLYGSLFLFSSAQTKQAMYTWLLTKQLEAILMPALSGLKRTELQARMADDLGRVALALGGYRAAHGRYPDKLAELSPAFLKHVPEDLFIDKPLHYRHEKTQAKPKSGGSGGEVGGAEGGGNARRVGGVVVYSVGKNQKDDGGTAKTFSYRPDITVHLPAPR